MSFQLLFCYTARSSVVVDTDDYHVQSMHADMAEWPKALFIHSGGYGGV